MKTALFDDNYLLVNDNLSLYLLDLRNNESSLIKPGISDFFVVKNRIIIQTDNGEFLELSNEQDDTKEQNTEQQDIKQSNNSEDNTEVLNSEEQTAKEPKKEKKPKAEKADNNNKLADSITEDDIEDFASEGDIYRVQQKGKSTVILQHKYLGYQIELDSDVFSKLIIEEHEQNNIISAGFYYEAQGIQAFIFSIDNYTRTEWDELAAAVPYDILGETPVRVLSYWKAQENPFPPSSKESEEFLRLVEKAPSYVETFKFVKQ